MLFFHKSFNKRLLKHVSELDEFGLLPSDWQWHREKIEQLNNISEDMIDDLIHLHNAHQDLGETIPHILPLIQELHQDIEGMLKQDVVAIDAGTSCEGCKSSGDFDFGSVSQKASAITPVPGGIGPLTVACLLENLIKLNLKK